jgi:hypothetical protein
MLGFVIGLADKALFWSLDAVWMMQKEEVCRSVDQTVNDYLVKVHWTEPPWRRMCKEE